MYRMVLVLGVVGATVVSWGCGLAMRPVTVQAKPADWEALAGEWRGDYRMSAYDRHGTIAFRLTASDAQASGDVLMISDRFGWPYVGGPMRPGEPPGPMEPKTQLLSIRFVSAEDGMINGALDPYWDPDRQCWASASFLGSVDGDVIGSSFVSVCGDGFRSLKGQWRVERKPPSAGRSRHQRTS